MDILVNRTLYMSCQAEPGIEPRPSALKASDLPIEQTRVVNKQFELNCSMMRFIHTFTVVSVCLGGVCSHVVVFGLYVRLSWYSM